MKEKASLHSVLSAISSFCKYNQNFLNPGQCLLKIYAPDMKYYQDFVHKVLGRLEAVASPESTEKVQKNREDIASRSTIYLKLSNSSWGYCGMAPCCVQTKADTLTPIS